MAIFLILLPLLSILVLNLPFKVSMKKAALSLGIFFCLSQIALVLVPTPEFWLSQPDWASNLFKLHFGIDPLSRTLLLAIGIVMLSTLTVGNELIQNHLQKFNFFNLLIIALAGMNGIVLVRDIFTLYIFLEITVFSSFVLIAFQREKEGLEGAFKYIVMSSVATVLMLIAIALILLISGDTSFSALHEALKTSSKSFYLMLAIGIFLSGLFVKAGLMPFHGWLPDAYSSAPAPVSILLAGIVTKSLGVYSLMRIVESVFGFNPSIQHVLMLVGTISIVLGALAALGQNDFKRMLAYSSISQVGYIILSFGCGTPLGIAGAIFHLFNHAVFKSLLFVNSASVEKATGTRNMDQLGGLSAKMPITGTSSVIACLSVAGVPPLSGFWSKLIIIIALWTAGHYTYAVIAVLASLLTLGYMLMIQRKVFWGKLKEGFESIREGGLGLTLPSIILAAITVVLGVLAPLLIYTFLIPINR